MTRAAVARLGFCCAVTRAATIRATRIAGERYEPPPLARTSAGRSDLRMAAYLLALRDALVESGTPAEAAGELLAGAVYRVMRHLQRPLDLLAASMHPRNADAGTRFREQLARKLFYRPPDWVMTDLDVPGCYAFDVHRCVYADYLGGRGEGRFCEQVLCAQDHRMAEGRGQPLLRTGTIAGGADRCDFRYVITSPTHHRPGEPLPRGGSSEWSPGAVPRDQNGLG